MSLWMLIPYPVRVGFWVVMLALIVWLYFHVDSLMEAHYTAQQNELVAADAARTEKTKARLLEVKNAALVRQLAIRDQRIAAARVKEKEQDDEMARLKTERPEVAEWAKQPVPDAVRARHGGVR